MSPANDSRRRVVLAVCVCVAAQRQTANPNQAKGSERAGKPDARGRTGRDRFAKATTKEIRAMVHHGWKGVDRLPFRLPHWLAAPLLLTVLLESESVGSRSIDPGCRRLCIPAHHNPKSKPTRSKPKPNGPPPPRASLRKGPYPAGRISTRSPKIEDRIGRIKRGTK